MKLAHRTTTNNWLPSLIDEMFTNDYMGGTAPIKSWNPAVNISEADDKFELDMIIPGFKKENISIEVDQDILTISSEVINDKEEKTEQFTRKEFTLKSFSRSFNLPDTVNKEDIAADYNDGILNVVLPKKEEALPQPKRMITLK